MTTSPPLSPTQLEQQSKAAFDAVTMLRNATTMTMATAVTEAMAISESYRKTAEAAAEAERLAELAGPGSERRVKPTPEAAKAANAALQRQRALVTALAGQLSPQSLIQLAVIASDPRELGSVRVSALDKIVERSVGKATTPMMFDRNDIYAMPIGDAIAALGEAASSGRISIEELNAHTRLLETKVKSIEIETIVSRMDELEAQLSGRKTDAAAGTRAH